jgi:hypothetical protein
LLSYVRGDMSASIVWRRDVDPSLHIYVRPDGVLVLGDELIDVPSGAEVSEPPWDFLKLRRRSLQKWTPSISPADDQSPKKGDNCYARMYQGEMWLGKTEGGDVYPPEFRVLIQARDASSEMTIARLDASGLEDLSMWLGWLRACDGCVMKRPDPNRGGRKTLRYPDLGSGSCRWMLSWDTRTWPKKASASRIWRGKARPVAGESVILFDTEQPVIGAFDTPTGALRWRLDLDGTVPVSVRACDRYVVVCAFPANTAPRPAIEVHGGHRPVRLAGACACGRPVAGRDPNICGSCGGFFRPWMRVSVQDRATGASLWERRWPWDDPLGGLLASIQALSLAGSPSGPVLATQEANDLRAWQFADGSPLWSVPLESLAAPGKRSRSRANAPFSFGGTATSPLTPWIWLREYIGGSGEQYRNSLIDPLTARQIPLPGLFYLHPDGLALTKTGDTLSCLAVEA